MGASQAVKPLPRASSALGARTNQLTRVGGPGGHLVPAGVLSYGKAHRDIPGTGSHLMSANDLRQPSDGNGPCRFESCHSSFDLTPTETTGIVAAC